MNSSSILIHWQKLKSLSQLLATPATDPQHQRERLRFMERDIGLPVRFVVLSILFYYLFLSNWFEGLSTIGVVTLETVQQFLLAYVVINVGAACVFIWMDQVPFAVVQWVAVLLNFIDGLFIAAVTLVTGGLESVAYWVFLALIMRNAFSFPVAALQVGLNVLMIACYLFAGILDKAISQVELATLEDENKIRSSEFVERTRSARPRPQTPITESPPALRSLTKAKKMAQSIETFARSDISVTEPEQNTQYFLMRIVLLMFMTACCYGVQVMFDKQRQAEDEAHEFTLRQEQLRSAGRLAAEIAHQIKNPLGIINNAAFTLQRTVKEGKGTITQQIQIIREEVERSDRIITELIGYAQLAEGKLEKLNVIEELESAIARVFPPAVQYPVEIRRDYGAALPALLIQRPHLSEIFVNLLQNAREALDGQGIIEVGVLYAEHAAVEVTLGDNGPGIPAELREKIFESYFTTKERGTGLGLAIVKHNVELYGGSVRVESELGKGARFILLFPARPLLKLLK